MNSKIARTLILAGMMVGACSAWADTKTRISTFEYDADGLLVKETINPDVVSACLQTAYIYNAQGSIVSRSSSACPGASGHTVASASQPRTTTTTYTSDGRFPAVTTNALGQSESKEYDPVFGGVTKLTGPNGLVSTWEYDGFGRKTKEVKVDGTSITWEYLLCGQSGASCPGAIAGNASKWTVVQKHWRVDGINVNEPTRRTYYDALGRVTRSQFEGFPNNGGATPWWAQDTEYDSLGRISRKSDNYTLNQETPQWTTFVYDGLGRVTEQREPNSDASGGIAVTKYAFNGLVTTVLNPKGLGQTTHKDARGKPVKVTDTYSKAILYTYDARGNLTETNADGVVTTIGYDHRGNKVTSNDKAMGAWTYNYNAFGELVEQRDSLNQVTTLDYDRLGRLIKRTEPDLISEWSYDKKFDGTACGPSIGKLCEAKAGNDYRRVHVYEVLGRPASTATTLDSGATAQTFSWSYASDTGRVIRQTWPTGYQVRYGYTSRGYLSSVISGIAGSVDEGKFSALERNARGQLVKYAVGGVITTVNTFGDTNGLLTATEVTTTGQAAGNLLNQSYGYDVLSNLTSRVDNSPGTGTQESFTYDNLRLRQYTLLGGAVSPPKVVEMRYDSRGNITYKSDVGTYTYDSTRPDRLKSIATTTASGAQIAVTGTRAITYTWDDALAGAQSVAGVALGNGNLQLMVSRDAVNNRNLYTRQTYTSFNMPSQIARGAMNGTAEGPATHTLNFVYGPEHQRVKQTVTGGDRAGTTWYLNGEDSLGLGFEKTVFSNGLTENKHFLVASGITFATYTSRSGTLAGKAAKEINYLLQDNLGSVVAVASQTGDLIERLAYDPWGKRRDINGTADPTDAIQAQTGNRGFTMHEHLEEVALTHMNGRIYDSYIGRFLTADPFIQNANSLQSYNRYAYVTNLPLTLTDPTGYFSLSKAIKSAVKFLTSPTPKNAFNAFASMPFQSEIDRAILKTPVLNAAGQIAVTAFTAWCGGCGGVVWASYFSYRATGSMGAAYKSAAISAGTAAGFYGAGELAELAGAGAQLAAHAAVGCATSVANNGQCGSGAITSVMALVATVPLESESFSYNLVLHAVVGGVTSALTGGSFEGGAKSGAYGYLFNQFEHCIRGGREDSCPGRMFEDLWRIKSGLPSGNISGSISAQAGAGFIGSSLDVGFALAVSPANGCVFISYCGMIGPQYGWGAGVNIGVSNAKLSSGLSSSTAVTYFGGSGLFGAAGAAVGDGGDYGVSKSIVKIGVGNAAGVTVNACTQLSACGQ